MQMREQGPPGESARARTPALLLAAAAFVATVGIAAPADAAPRTCEIAERDGPKLEAWRSGAWRAQQTGPLSPDVQRLRTGPVTRAEIRCDDGVVLTLSPDAELVLADFIGPLDPADSVLLRLSRGLLGIIAPHRRGRRFDVETPLAIASARSTEWTVDVAPGGPTGGTVAVFVREGRVETHNSVGARRLDAGEGVTYERPDQRPAVRRWGAARVEAMRERLGFSWK